jgi:hypothetical protein
LKQGRTPFVKTPSSSLFRSKPDLSPTVAIPQQRYVNVDEIGMGDLCQELNFAPKDVASVPDKYVYCVESKFVWVGIGSRNE